MVGELWDDHSLKSYYALGRETTAWGSKIVIQSSLCYLPNEKNV